MFGDLSATCVLRFWGANARRVASFAGCIAASPKPCVPSQHIAQILRLGRKRYGKVQTGRGLPVECGYWNEAFKSDRVYFLGNGEVALKGQRCGSIGAPSVPVKLSRSNWSGKNRQRRTTRVKVGVSRSGVATRGVRACRRLPPSPQCRNLGLLA